MSNYFDSSAERALALAKPEFSPRLRVGVAGRYGVARLRNRLVAGGSVVTVAALFAIPAGAVEYSFGEVSGTVDTVLSAGASMRTSKRDCSFLGAPTQCGKIRDASGVEKGGGVNSDDGNLNYDQWDVFSGAMKATSEVGASWRNFNAFVRGTGFYDPLVDNTKFRRLSSAAKSEVSRNAKLLDYFVGGRFEVAERPVELRVGNQVISWGESTFIQNGINVINPIDVAAVRKPGSEVKEFFTPILAAKGSIGLPMNISLEGFYQFKSDNIVPDPAGTFFSAADIVGRGSEPIRAGVADFGDDERFNPFQIANGIDTDIFVQSRHGINVPSVSIERANDVNADDGGEFGFALRYFNEELNNGMEFGLYFMNLHSRLPIVTTQMATMAAGYSIATGTNFSAASRIANALTATNGVTGATPTELVPANAGTGSLPGNVPANAFEAGQQLCNLLAGLGATLAAQGMGSANGAALGTTASVNFATPGGFTNCNTILTNRTGAADIERNLGAVAANGTKYRLEYPEDIKLVGASVSTTLGSIAFQAEATYRHDQPMSYVGAEVSALSSDLNGLTAMITGAPLPAGVGSPLAPARPAIEPTRFYVIRTQAGNQVAAATADPTDGIYTYNEIAPLLDAQGLYPGALSTPALTPTPGLAAAAAAAATGTLTVAALPGAFFVGGVNTGAAGLLAGTGAGTIPGGPVGSGPSIPAPAAGSPFVGLGGSAFVAGTAAQIAANPAGTTFVAFPVGTAGGLVAIANTLGFIPIDVEQLAAVPALAPGATVAPLVPNGRLADVLFARHADSGGTGLAPLTPLTPITRASSLTAANVRPDGFIEIPTEDVITAQSTFTSILFGSNPLVQFADADSGTLVTEVGMVYVPGISTNSAIAARGSEGLLNPIAAATYKLNADLKGPTNYATPFSWGAQGIFNLTYNRAFGTSFNLVPGLAWKWDFGGRTPSPLGNYNAETKALGLSLGANYQSRWTGNLSWTMNFGPDAPAADRDFASATISYAF